ncbi:hypothetical protein [Staphylococcus saprophyticus]|uniref:hypothetical protein n=1 Tax=Staphylococcus saprophyticus TaxID=29385 RepID=UPI00124406F7|nr:hypothetical protein [Staphylococcus saprophyticus]
MGMGGIGIGEGKSILGGNGGGNGGGIGGKRIGGIGIGNRYKGGLKGESCWRRCKDCEGNKKRDGIGKIVINGGIVGAENDLFLKSLRCKIG